MTQNSEEDLLRGIHELVNPQNVKHGLNYEEIEKKLSNSGDLAPEQTDPAESFKSELSDLAKTLGLEFNSPNFKTPGETPGSARASSRRKSPREQYSDPYSDDFSSARQSSRGSDPLLSPMDRGEGSSRRKKETSFYDDESHERSSNRDDEHRSGGSSTPEKHNEVSDDLGLPPELSGLFGNDDSESSSHRSDRESKKSSFPDFDYGGSRNGRQSEFSRRTEEEYRHDQVKSVISSLGGEDDSKFVSLDEANREDEKTIMLEEIDSLRASLEEEESRGLDKIPSVSQDDEYASVENVLRRLRLKNDRARYTTLANEFILWGAQGMEEIFDGKRRWFGKNPNLSGWSKEVQVKLRRMQHDTSTLVSGVMHDYNIGPGMRIILELVPNLFMFAKRKKQNYGKRGILSDDDINQHLNNIRNIDE